MIPDDDYEMRDDDAPAEMSSSTIDRNAMRLIAENQKKKDKPKSKLTDAQIEAKADAQFKKNEAQNKKGSAKVALADSSYDRMERMRGMYPNSSSRGLRTPATTMMKKGGSVGSASKRADGIASKGKTKGRFI
jgi:hypothetical protein